MDRVFELLTFAKEFIADRTSDSLNENIIWALKEASDKALIELKAEHERYWDMFQVPVELKTRYLRLHKECKACVSRLSKLGPRGQAKLRQNHLFAISDDEDDSFENPTACLDHLKGLLLDLEIQYKHCLKSQTEDHSADLGADSEAERVKLPLVLFTDFSECFSKLNKLFRLLSRDSGTTPGQAEDMGQAKALIFECQKERLLVHIWNLLRDFNKIVKLIGKVLQSCRFLYGDRLVVQAEAQRVRKESASEIMSSLVNKPISSMKMSMNLSKIRTRHSFKNNDSFANDINEIFYADDMSLKTRGMGPGLGGGEVRKSSPKRQTPPPPIEYPGQKLVIQRLPEDDAFGRCYCRLF